MAFNKAPSAWLPNASYSSNQFILNTAANGSPTLPELNATNANATTGDIRQVVFAILDKLYASWLATAPADRPNRLTISRTTSEDQYGNIVRDYAIRVYVAANDAETVISEA